MWTRKKKKTVLKSFPKGVTRVNSNPDEPQIKAVGITDSHVVSSESGLRLVYWQNGEYHDALIPSVLAPSFFRVMAQNADLYGYQPK